MLERDLWDYNDHEELTDRDLSGRSKKIYKYNGNYIYEERRVFKINHKFLAAFILELEEKSEGLFQPKTRVTVDMDGDVYLRVCGWREMTPEDHDKRETLRAVKKERERIYKQISEREKSETERQKCSKNCPFCRRG